MVSYRNEILPHVLAGPKDEMAQRFCVVWIPFVTIYRCWWMLCRELLVGISKLYPEFSRIDA